MASNPRRQLEEWLKTIEVNGEVVFDVGGAQLPVKDRIRSFKTDRYFILDKKNPHELSDRALEYLDKGGFDIEDPELFLDRAGDNEYLGRFVQFVNSHMAYQISTNALKDADTMTSVFCLEVMEYVLDPVVAIKNLRNLCSPNSNLYISFGFLYPHHNPVGMDALRYTEWGAVELLRQNGFEVEEITPRKLTPEGDALLQEFYRAEGMRASKEAANHHASGWLIKAIAV